MELNLLALETSSSRWGVALLRAVDGRLEVSTREHEGLRAGAVRPARRGVRPGPGGLYRAARGLWRGAGHGAGPGHTGAARGVPPGRGGPGGRCDAVRRHRRGTGCPDE
ncbi:hypothetical protein G6F31_021293 [Rhizopus arrhizus]|nr:hypothetical protein G6F31_021293 [Rhizopus arrhizus]